MEPIVEGVSVQCHPLAVGGIAERLQVSAGTVGASGPGRESFVYRSWARIPMTPWRYLTVDELGRLNSGSDGGRPAGVRILRIPDRLYERLHSGFGDAELDESGARLSEILANDEYRARLEELAEFVGEMGELTRRPLVRINRPGLPTTTVDDGMFYIGLHVDNWYGHELGMRHASPNRICINIGRESRYFLFINLSMSSMFSLLRRDGAARIHPGLVGTPLGLAFMRTFPAYPVLRLRIDPGEGYLAPTEDLVHDASTVGLRSWDLAVHILGRFTV
jgi:hypothetical protein